MRLLKSTAIALLVSALYGCGGGGGGGGSSTVSLSGVAAKGLIQKGKVEVFATDSSGNLSSTPIATGVTLDDGTYSISVPPQSNPVVVKVSKGTGTTIIDETAPAGTPAIAMPDDFIMRAVVPSIASTSTVGINPFTETAVAAIPANSFSAAMVKSSNDWVKQNLTGGVDPVTVSPNLSGSASASDDQKLLTAALTSVAVAAKSSSGSCATEADTAAKFKCQVNKLSSAVSMKKDSSGAITVASVDGAELSKLATARTTLSSDSAYTSTLSTLGISTAVNTLKSDSKLSSVVTATGGAKTTDATALASIAPRSETAITAGASATTYANNLKTAIKSSGDTIKKQSDAFNAAYQDKVLPSLNSVSGGLQIIDNACAVSSTDASVTCSTGKISLLNGDVTLTGSGSTYAYSGTYATNQTIKGDIVFTPNFPSLVMKVSGTFPNEATGATKPLDVDMQFTITVDKTAKVFSAVIDKASVVFPAGTSTIASTVSLTNGKIEGVLINGNAQRNCATWPCTYTKQDGATDQAGLVKSITGILSVASTNGDKLSANLDAQMFVPTQAVWTSLSAQQRYAIKDKSMIDKLTMIAGLDLSTGENYSATIIADPDYSKVDLTKDPSSTNFAMGYMQLIIDLGKTSASSLGKLDFKVDRATYTTAKPSVSFSIGSFDKLTAIPNNTDNTYVIAVPSTPITDITSSASIWLDLQKSSNALADGIKITSANSEYVSTLKKDSSGNTNGTVKNKDGSTVGEIKSGVLYIDGSIFSLQ